jgi:hypothetical protein
MATVNYTQSIFIQEGLNAFVAALTPANAFSRSYSGVTAQKGNSIIVPRVDALTATTFAYTNNSSRPYEAGGGTINSITVTLDQHKYVTVDITDIQAANQGPAVMSNFYRQMGKALGRHVMETIWAGFTTVNFGLGVASASVASIGRTKINAARTAMVGRNVPTDTLALIVNPTVHQTLLDDANISQAFQFGGSEGIRDARIPRLLGMDVYESNIFPANAISLVGAVVHPDALAIAVRALQPQRPEAYSMFQIATDDQSGLSMGYREYFEPATGKLYGTMECVFGSAVGLSLGAGLIQRLD